MVVKRDYLQAWINIFIRHTEDAKRLKNGDCEKMGLLTDQQVIEYFHRSYKAADGLWFMKMEAKHGFDAALELDKEVWKVMPKIQARVVKSMLRLGEGEAALLKSLEAKLSLEGFKFKVKKRENGFQIQINNCPWQDLMMKGGEKNILEK